MSTKQQESQTDGLGLEALEELLKHMDKNLAALMVLSYFGTIKHREQTVQALYELEYLEAKKKQIDALDPENTELRQKAIDNLRKNGYIIS
jgi:hypothetical protein